MAAIPDDRIVAFINDIAYECEQSVTVQFLLDSPRGSLDRLLEENGDDKKVFWSSFSNVLTINLKTSVILLTIAYHTPLLTLTALGSTLDVRF